MRIFKSYPKINICLKIIGTCERNGVKYCEFFSRFVRVENLFFDTLAFSESEKFTILGDFECQMEQNLIFKAKEILKSEILQNGVLGDIAADKKMRFAGYLEKFSIEVDKQIPTFAGLGGGSSNAATYLLAMNEILELKLNTESLLKIAAKIGADVSFFAADVLSANVSGIGDKISEFSECGLKFDIQTPQIACNTKEVYDKFRQNAYFSDKKASEKLLDLDSKTLLESYNIIELNDLYRPAVSLYPELSEYVKDGYFFSGSGSSFFKIMSEK